MPTGIPPKNEVPVAHHQLLPSGSFLWRIDRSGRETDSPFRPPAESHEVDSDRWSERFDPTPECPYPYCYAAFDDLTALCEVLLRDVRFDARLRYLPMQAVAGRSLVLLETLRPLWLVSLLDAADLAAVRQDSWLVHIDWADYPITRLWAHWLRESTSPVGDEPPAGIVWPSKRQPSGRVVLLFGDRCGDAVVRSSFGERRLDRPEGQQWLRRRLSLLRTGFARAGADV